MSSEERDEREQVTEDANEDLELDEEQADSVRGGLMNKSGSSVDRNIKLG